MGRHNSVIVYRGTRRFTRVLGSTYSSTDLSTRSLGSRGSLCDVDADDCDSINVVVRCRPLNDKEIKRREESIASFPGEGQIWINLDGVHGQPVQKPKVFTYNVVFEPEATQEDILDHCGATKLVDMAIDGFSCTIFCYGQTGSGKTHTLTGPPNLFDKKGVDLYSADHGLIFRSLVYLFNQLQNFTDREFTVKGSFLEIYNEKVIDLLNMGTHQKPLQVRWNKRTRGFFVENLFNIECYELDDLLAILEEGLRNRAVASHNMNEYSSRSHTILSVSITSEQKAEEGVTITKNGKINFVDLAGSEMTKKTQSEGKTLEEANNINKSLMVLGTCISALSDPKKKEGHIPYRDSKLTKLLADSLAGSGVTLMIACVSPAKYNLSETLNTLRYACRAKHIRTKPIVIMDPKEKAILALKREVNQLQEENQNLKMLLDVGGSGSTPPGLTSFMIDLRKGDPSSKGSTTTAAKSAAMALAGTVGTSEALRKGLQQRRTSLRIDDDKLKSLDMNQLISLLKKYICEYDSVKKENKELQLMTGALLNDQEMIAKENERLIRKLEETESGSSRPPPNSANYLQRMQRTLFGNRGSQKSAQSPTDVNGYSQVWVNPNGSPQNLFVQGSSENLLAAKAKGKNAKMDGKLKKTNGQRSLTGPGSSSSDSSSRMSSGSSITDPPEKSNKKDSSRAPPPDKKKSVSRAKSLPRLIKEFKANGAPAPPQRKNKGRK